MRAASVYLSVSTIVTIRAPRYRVYSGIAELLDYKKNLAPHLVERHSHVLVFFRFRHPNATTVNSRK